ncbi:MAG: hypothetical protein IK059_01815 [Firmicutes bacterium]|nr:hypothetical protein [Bacillota bacterium]
MKSSFEPKKFKRMNKATAGNTAVACLLIFVMAFSAFLTGCGGDPAAVEAAKDAAEMTVAELAELHENEAAELIEAWEPKEITSEMQTQRLIAHGGGAFNGCMTSNSVEALMNAADNAYALIELDMSITTDGHVVMIHDWDVTSMYYYRKLLSGPVSYEEFMALSPYDNLHAMDIESLIAIMDKSSTFKVVTDIKLGFSEVLTKIAEDYPEYLDRFVVQIYDYDQLEGVRALGYDNVILTLYTMQGAIDPEKIAKFYFDNKLKGITVVDDEYMDKIVRTLTAKKVTVYRHPVSDYERFLEEIDDTVYGIYTSSILPQEIVGVNANYYITMPKSAKVGKTEADRKESKGIPGEKAAGRGHLPGYLTAADPGKVKLTCYDVQGETVEDIVALTVHGIKENQYRIYYIGDEGTRMTNQGLDELPYGLIHMPVEIWEVERPEGPGHFTGITLDYYLWKDEGGVALFDGKYDYRAMSRKVIPSMDDAFDKAVAQKKDKNDSEYIKLLKNSFIAHAGDYYYYNNGEPGISLCEDEYFYAALGSANDPGEGSSEVGIYVPVAEAARALGAIDVGMTADEQIAITLSDGVGGEVTDLTTRNSYPNMPYLRKTLTYAGYLAKLTGRPYSERAEIGLCIIFPEGTNGELVASGLDRIFELAGALY